MTSGTSKREKTPDIQFLEAVARGEILLQLKKSKIQGELPVWFSSSGLLLIRLHEEAGYIERMLTAKWAGYPAALYQGLPVRLTQKGLDAIDTSPDVKSR